MDLFVARQPIFDLRLEVIGYELLFRNGPANFFPAVAPDLASAQVISDALHVFGLEDLSAGRQLYINVTRDVLLRGLVSLLPPRTTTVEILETVTPDAEVLAACRTLKDAGYTLALDDFVCKPEFRPLIELASVVKVDFLQTTGAERANLVERHRGKGRRFLAEKIESTEEQADAVRCGYELFQGYFFCRPQMVTTKQIPAFKLNYLRLLSLSADPVFDFQRIEQVIKQEVSLSVKLLRYLNSAMFGWFQKVTSIKQALVLLGEGPFRKWLALVAAAGLGEDSAEEVVVTSLVRARFCEQLGPRAGFAANNLELFLLGMLSLVDVLMGRPMRETLEKLALTGAVSGALLEDKGTLAPLLALVRAWEQGQWAEVSRLCAARRLDESEVGKAYRDALDWAGQVFTRAER